jgi:hypothetical protein
MADGSRIINGTGNTADRNLEKGQFIFQEDLQNAKRFILS